MASGRLTWVVCGVRKISMKSEWRSDLNHCLFKVLFSQLCRNRKIVKWSATLRGSSVMIWNGYIKSLGPHCFVSLPVRIFPTAAHTRKPVFPYVYSAVNLRYLEYKKTGNVQQNINQCIGFYEFITSRLLHMSLCVHVPINTFPLHLRNLPVIVKIYHDYIQQINTEILPTVEIHIFNMQDMASCGPTVFRYSHNCKSEIFTVIQTIEELSAFCRTRAAFPQHTRVSQMKTLNITIKFNGKI